MELKDFFAENPKVAVAFSGGVDSAYLLWAANHYGADVRAYYVKSAFQPQFELNDAKRLVSELGARLTIIELDGLSCGDITANSPERCYFCKRTIFSAIADAAAKDGYTTLIDGNNASDDASDRPGMRAAKELNVRSPLREAGLTKAEIRNLSKEAGLFTWNKPAYACLATRIPTGDIITCEKLKKTELAEDYLSKLGIFDHRVRLMGNAAKIQVPGSCISTVLENRQAITAELKKYYDSVLLDLEVRDE